MSLRYGEGWVPGLIGWCVAEHGRYYAEHWGFTAFFEAKVAGDMADFARRLDAPGNHLFWARDAEGFVATLSLDATDADDQMSHLRWFIAGNRTRGQGVGKELLQRCIAAARGSGAAGIFLTTFAGLDAARKLYENEASGWCMRRRTRPGARR